MKIVEIDFYC